MRVDNIFAWTSALQRAADHRIRVDARELALGPTWSSARATSGSTPGVTYAVRVRRQRGVVEVVCTCRGGQRGRCQHAAAVLRYLGVLPPLAVLQAGPAPAPAPAPAPSAPEPIDDPVDWVAYFRDEIARLEEKAARACARRDWLAYEDALRDLVRARRHLAEAEGPPPAAAA
ncbi:MAG TPA: SWIM zinc finger family protein [Zeimonas sp.]|nr:SWIM zinc finger family protein [Zeimonas sp.]